MLQHAANLPAIGLFNFSAASESEIGSWIAINDQLPVYFILTGLITEKNEKIVAFRTVRTLLLLSFVCVPSVYLCVVVNLASSLFFLG